VAERKKAVIHKSPAGIAQYPRLTKPDTKFKPEGEYKVTLVLTGAEAQPLIELIDKAMGESLIEARRADPTKAKTIKAATDKPYKAETDDEGNETGNYKFNFKMAARITSKKTGETWEQKPDLFDAKGKVLVNPKIGGGSTVKVAFELYLFYTKLVGAGVSLRLRAVQVLDLVEYNSRSASGYGFGEEEGYEAGEQPADTKSDVEVTPDPAVAAQQEDDEVPF
jgi:hypothetical protein